MKAIRNVAIVALLAATPLAFAHRGSGEGVEGGCQGAKSPAQGMSERHAERQAQMAAMHQGMHGRGMTGMQHGDGRGHEPGRSERQDEKKN